MLAPFPRTSVYPTIRPRVHKNNKKLGKVSYQMQKIIEDIQGSRPEKDSKNKNFTKTECEVQRKRVNVREKEEAAYHERRSQRRKSRKTREDENEFREMACQTTMLVVSEECGNNNRQSQICMQPISVEENCERLDKPTMQSNLRPPGNNCRMDTKRANVGERSSGFVNPPWRRPLPPVPEPYNFHQTKSQANLYHKVFETLKDKIGNESVDVSGGRCYHDNRWASLSCSPRKSLSKQIDDRDLRKDTGFSRYVDIDVLSEKKHRPGTIAQNRAQTSSTCTRETSEDEDYKNDDDEHIYESIDENSDCEFSSKAGRCRQLFPRTPEIKSGKFVNFSPSFATPCSLRTFRHDETYLEPICLLDSLECNRRNDLTSVCSLRPEPIYPGPEFQNKSPDCEHPPTPHLASDTSSSSYDNTPSNCLYPITDFQYSRDSARSPTWSSHSATDESISLKAIYV